MAISTSSYFSNSIVGVPQVAGEYVDLYDSTENAKYALGTKYERQDGAVFRYAHFAQATSAGFVVATVQSDTMQLIIGATIQTPSSTYQMADEQNGIYPGSLSSRYFVTTATTTAADQYAGALAIISAKGGAGYSYRIKGNTLTGDPATGKARFQLYDKLVAAVGTDSALTIVGSQYGDLVPASTTHTTAVGVSVTNQTATYFGWIQTQGPIGVWQDAGASGGSAGQVASISSATAGMVAPGLMLAAAINTAIANIPVSVPKIGIYLSSSTGSTLAAVKVMLE